MPNQFNHLSPDEFGNLYYVPARPTPESFNGVRGSNGYVLPLPDNLFSMSYYAGRLYVQISDINGFNNRIQVYEPPSTKVVDIIPMARFQGLFFVCKEGILTNKLINTGAGPNLIRRQVDLISFSGVTIRTIWENNFLYDVAVSKGVVAIVGDDNTGNSGRFGQIRCWLYDLATGDELSQLPIPGDGTDYYCVARGASIADERQIVTIRHDAPFFALLTKNLFIEEWDITDPTTPILIESRRVVDDFPGSEEGAGVSTNPAIKSTTPRGE